MNNEDTNQIPQPQEMMLEDISVRPEDFQFRDFDYDNYHVEELKKAIEQGRDVGPLDVWKDPADGRHYILDGHHRYEAYFRLNWSQPVKILLHHGEYHQVRLIALRENTKARLPMTATERANAAWRLTCESHEGSYRYSKRVIRECTGVADGTVAAMRRTYKTLEAAQSEIPDKWHDALRVAKGFDSREMTDEDQEQMIIAMMNDMDKQFGKAVAEAARRCPEALTRVLELRMGREFKYMIEINTPAADDDDDFPF